MRRLGCALALSMLATAASAQSVLVQQVCGFGYIACGTLPLTEVFQDGPAIDYLSDGTGQAVFTLAYAGDSFIMEATHDNTVATTGGLPYGLIGWPNIGPQVPPDGGLQPPTNLFFAPWFDFPTLAGQQLVFSLPTVAVPEPTESALMVAGLMAIAAMLRARRREPEAALVLPPRVAHG